MYQSRSRFGRGSGRPKNQGAYIHPSRFINKAVEPKQQVEFTPKHKFSDFKINQTLKNNVISHGYISPTPIQDGSIPFILDGRDLIGLANTGTGKTAAFIIPMINNLAENQNATALIVAPTRELASQINDEFRMFSGGFSLNSVLCVGGTSLYKQVIALNRNPRVIIGTPGRLKDLVNRRKLNLSKTKILIFDEVDRMLDMGFINDINFLVSFLPKEKQSLCFSATLTPSIEKVIAGILANPVTVSVRTKETSENVNQDIIRYNSPQHKHELLEELLRTQEYDKVLIFGQTKHGVQNLSDELVKKGFRSKAIHGNKSQPQRQKALDAFKNNSVKILVATDVAARGLDIPNVSHVINFDQPNTYEDYVHRIGRTGRAGKSGQALTFVK